VPSDRAPQHAYAGGISKHAGRRTRRYRMLRANYRAACAAFTNPDGTVGACCWLCGKTLDYSLPDNHPEGFNLDHAIPVSVDPALAEDPANFRSAHQDCNQRRGDQAPFIELGQLSEDW
jgi:5-methylcytosine-specific restriction endonuclease McrA